MNTWRSSFGLLLTLKLKNMETTSNAYDLLCFLFVGGLLGILGQGIRIIIGLKKLDQQRAIDEDKAELFTSNRLFVSIFIGFIAGSLALLTKWGTLPKFDHELILTIITAGYAGADFIEGLFNTYFKKLNSTGQAREVAARSGITTKKLNYPLQKQSLFTVEDEVKIAILVTDGEFRPDPSSLNNDKEMSDFNFSDMQHIVLTDRFNDIVKNRNPNGKAILISQILDCKTVQDCIDLVTNAI
jgi:hypothetical protein